MTIQATERNNAPGGDCFHWHMASAVRKFSARVGLLVKFCVIFRTVSQLFISNYSNLIMKTKIFMVWCLLAAFVPATAQQKSEKRGVCWDEKTQQFSDAPIEKMSPGVSWIYTWGEAPKGTAANLDAEGGIDFAPMAWGRDFNENAIRNYVKEHKNTKYLLGFNEPNFSAQANVTPDEAAGCGRNSRRSQRNMISVSFPRR